MHYRQKTVFILILTSTILKKHKIYFDYLQNTSDPIHLLFPFEKTHYLGGILYRVALCNQHALPSTAKAMLSS